MDIRTEQNFIGEWQAIDASTYDCDCDQDGFYSLSPVGHGKTEDEAVADLLDQIGEAACERHHTPFVFLAVDIRQAAGDMIEKIGALTAHEHYGRMENAPSFATSYKLMDLRDLRKAVESASAALNKYDALILEGVDLLTREQFERISERTPA